MNSAANPLAQLRELRRRARQFHGTMVDDLKPFLHKKNKITFRRLPGSDLDSDAVGVTVTCTSLMALATARRLGDIYDTPDGAPTGGEKAVDLLLLEPWDSSRLDEGNKFTIILALRAAGILSEAQPGVKFGEKRRDGSKLPKAPGPDPDRFIKITDKKSIWELAKDIVEESGAPESIRVGRYPPTSTLIYWFVDAFGLLGGTFTKQQWISFAEWTSREFSRHVSLVSAGHDAMMDPVAMAMASCLAARLRRMVPAGIDPKEFPSLSEVLPARIELINAILLLFRKQEPSGIWPKYFPLFHYPDAGANYCFSFEMLEAVLAEFEKPKEDEGEDILSDPTILEGLGRALDWIGSNRVAYAEYRGWNSGGQLQTLRAGIPESWATALVHMFLSRLDHGLSLSIERRLLTKYEAMVPVKSSTGPDWNGILDIVVEFPKEPQKTTIKAVLTDEIIDNIRKNKKTKAEIPIEHRLSALLFGPPGTSKTTLIRELAREIDWPYVEITPSHFLSKGLEQIYVRADEIFDDLMDLSRVVILFDEMDALVQRRDPRGTQSQKTEQPLDVTRQFLTTSMLPKLAKLHDRKRVLFFMATNHQSGFDTAIKRPGRFDLLLCMGPPTWTAKLAGMEFLVPRKLRKLSKEIGTVLEEKTKGRDVVDKLDKFTFGEIKSLLEHLCRREGKDTSALKEVVVALSADDLRAVIAAWTKDLITLSEADDAKSIVEEYKDDLASSRRQ